MVFTPNRRGLTLTELLVVVAIVVIVTSVLAPLLTPSLEGREVREAARQVNAYFQQARARARELGRPVGVMIRRSPAGDLARDFGYQLSLAEEPPPYTGVNSFSRARVLTFNNVPSGQAMIRDSADPNSFQRFVQPNDLIRFNLRGPKYRVLQVKAATQQEQQLYNSPYKVVFDTIGTPIVHFADPNSVHFEVFRRPRSTSSTPLELPTGTAIVMNLSGVGMDFVSDLTPDGEESQYVGNSPRQKYIGLTEFQRFSEAGFANLPLTIMFTTSGGIDRVFRILPPPETIANPNFPPKRPQDKIYLFLGKDGVDRWTNLQDESNLWITIDPANGSVNTAPNALPPGVMVSAVSNIQKLGAVASSRQLAATGQSMGGR